MCPVGGQDPEALAWDYCLKPPVEGQKATAIVDVAELPRAVGIEVWALERPELQREVLAEISAEGMLVLAQVAMTWTRPAIALLLLGSDRVPPDLPLG
jgi:hypothetical protein